MIKQFYYCSCYWSHNLYVKSLNKHFTYFNEDQFFKDYGEILNTMGCSSTDKENIIKEINVEIDRRKSVHQKSVTRREQIKSNYVPLDKSVYTLKREFLEPSFVQLVETSKCSDTQKVFQMVDTISAEKKIYGFPIFTNDFCKKLLEELSNFECSNLPKERPNTMNNYGILIDDLGFHDSFSLPLRTEYLDPLCKVLFPKWRGQGLDSHRIFTVGYKFGQDTELGYHFDNSEVTLNVCLGKKFEDGELYFGDMKNVPVSQSTCIPVAHKVGYGIFHRGQQLHGALPISSGERQNLVMWMRASSIRNSQCPMCSMAPSLTASEDCGDGFTKSEEIICNLC